MDSKTKLKQKKREENKGKGNGNNSSGNGQVLKVGKRKRPHNTWAIGRNAFAYP